MNSEPGANIVRASLVGALISAVNYSEVMKKTIERAVAVESLQALVKSAAIEIVPFDTELAEATAALYPEAKPYGLSLADRACIALGLQRHATVFTADGDWKLLKLSLKLKLIRNAN
jgi:PIN domain nuclease of toxin-antitoxin system